MVSTGKPGMWGRGAWVKVPIPPCFLLQPALFLFFFKQSNVFKNQKLNNETEKKKGEKQRKPI